MSSGMLPVSPRFRPQARYRQTVDINQRKDNCVIVGTCTCS